MEKKKIMIIDDEKDFIRITKLNLESTGKYEVLALSDGRDIIARAKDFNPDLLMTDLLMPSVEGLEICRMLNENPAGKKIPIIMLSALDRDEDKLKAYKAGVVDYLVKPIERDELIAKIEKALSTGQ